MFRSNCWYRRNKLCRYPNTIFFFLRSSFNIILRLAKVFSRQSPWRIRPGGGAYFQIPTHTPGYKFQIEEYLNNPLPGDGTDDLHNLMEMHALPMHVVFETLDRRGMVPVEVLMDAWTSLLGSHTFFAMKRD